MEFVDLFLALLQVQPFVLSLLDGLADGIDGLSSVQSRAQDASLDGIDLFQEL